MTDTLTTDRWTLEPDGLVTSDHRVAGVFLEQRDTEGRFITAVFVQGIRFIRESSRDEMYLYPITIPLATIARHVLVGVEYVGPVRWWPSERLDDQSTKLSLIPLPLEPSVGKYDVRQVQDNAIATGLNVGQLRQVVAILRETG